MAELDAVFKDLCAFMNDLSVERCYGCEISHPSQREHACLCATDDEIFLTNFDAAFDLLNKDKLLLAVRDLLRTRGLEKFC